MSNVHDLSGRSAVESEAREWLIRLDSDRPLTGAEAANLREWIERSPAHRQELNRICKFWDSANVLTEFAIPLRATEARRRSGLFNVSLWPSRLRLGTAVAVVLVGASVAIMSWFSLPLYPGDNGLYATEVGQQQMITLSDGSTVQMNTDSRLQVEYGDRSRTLRLLRGEAHFDVASDTSRPFEVYIGNGVVRAVGTAFSVFLKDAQDVRVTVTEGRVDIAAVRERPPDSGIGLPPDDLRTATQPPVNAPSRAAALEQLASLRSGQVGTFGSAIEEIRISELARQELQRRMSWRDGFLAFSGEPLSEVVAEANRYTPLNIEIADPQLEALRIDGRFEVGDLEAIFDVLESHFGIRVVRLGDSRVQLRSRYTLENGRT